MNRRILPFLILFFLTSLGADAQNQANRWYFGNLAGLDFSSGCAVPVFDGALVSFEGCASYSDEFGQHLFYTNGGGRDPDISPPAGTIWNRNHEVLYDMSFTEGGGFSARQSSLFVPNPVDPDRLYYLFTMEEFEFDAGGSVPGQPEGRGLSYFEIDRTLNGGLGGVTQADVRVEVPLFEHLGGTQHANGKDYWIFVLDWQPINPPQLDRLGVLLVDETGVSDITWYPLTSGEGYGGDIKVAPNGEHILLFTNDANLSILPFDNSTGEVLIEQETLVPVDDDIFVWSYSFSPNSQYIYFRASVAPNLDGEIYRLEMNAPDIGASLELIGACNSGSNPGQMQLGPDGNIYFIDSELGFYNSQLSRILCPNSATPSLELSFAEFPPGPTFLPGYGLPNFMDHIFESYQEGGIIDIGPDTLLICDGETYEIGSETCEGNYLWNTGETTPFITVSEPGIYVLTADLLCGTASDSIVILGSGAGSISIEGPSTICDGEPIELVAIPLGPTGGGGWLDNPGSNTLTVGSAGLYEYQFTDVCGASASITWEVTEEVTPQISLVPDQEQPFCEDEPLGLSATLNATVPLSWSTGSADPQISVEEDGTYFVTAENECGIASDTLVVAFTLCDCLLELPTAFSPNQDGVNDRFGLIEDCTLINDYRLLIFNRWGELVFESTDPAQKWDGSFQGASCPSEVYVWKMFLFLEGEEEGFTTSGELTLLR
jgi:gliding motility-associated-like protein